jgi:hypothetical protein
MGPAPEGALNLAAWQMIRDIVGADQRTLLRVLKLHASPWSSRIDTEEIRG